MRAKRVRAIRILSGWDTKQDKGIRIINGRRFATNGYFREYKKFKKFVTRSEFRRTL